MSNKKMISNENLENFLQNGSEPITNKPWHGLDPAGKRTGIDGISFVLNSYEKALLLAASKKEGSTLAAFVRQNALKKAKIILGVE